MKFVNLLIFYAFFIGCSHKDQGVPSTTGHLAQSTTSGVAEILIGRRFFEEPRFAEYFKSNYSGDVNGPLVSDPTLNTITVGPRTLPGPFAGQTMSCASCHLFDEMSGQGLKFNGNGGVARAPIPDRGDGLTTTLRNPPQLMNSTLDRVGLFLHFDGEFNSAEDLIFAGFTGRNFGWLVTQHQDAIIHIAKVVREDDGTYADLTEGYSYRQILTGDSSVPSIYQISDAVNVDGLSDKELVQVVAQLTAAYLNSLRFSVDSATGAYNSSAFDEAMELNGLSLALADPSLPAVGKSRNLLTEVEALEAAGTWQTTDDFDADATEGLKIFLREYDGTRTSGVGNCMKCHAAPDFTDFGFHTTGTAQSEYDTIHGKGAFATLAASLPDLNTRNANPELYLPATSTHPNWAGPYKSIPTASDSNKVDLSLWNFFARPDSEYEDIQEALIASLCNHNDEVDGITDCENNEEDVLPTTIASFKTPSLRGLPRSAPYMQDGQSNTLTSAVNHYRTASSLARRSLIYNADENLSEIYLTSDDVAQLVKFLRTLDEK